ncbi:CRISPR system precrRNA processing endoribonuclease RAMP protein Cas6 [Thermomonas alba]|uniref:CRISPR system precrRNA processing endoribonuclease RAMP protein Cas6 n=1 Tax=Thermomonas alba TaxID=2888525 RepID=UPI001F044383|nr:CRISPR system precrRNA processing endoribonuclease RAMP protein Cas6 [Thermomonas alba]
MPHSRLEWSDGERWSSRQGKTHPMGGVLGRFHMRGPLTPFLPLLHAGQWLHVGKHAAFGQGRYQLADTG